MLAGSSWESPGQGGRTEELLQPLPMEKLLELFLHVPPWRLVARPGVKVLEALCVTIERHSRGREGGNGESGAASE